MLHELDVICVGTEQIFVAPQPGNELLFHVVRSQSKNFERFKSNPSDFLKLCEIVLDSLAKNGGTRFIMVDKSATKWSEMPRSQALTVIGGAFFCIGEEKEGYLPLASETKVPSELTPFLIKSSLPLIGCVISSDEEENEAPASKPQATPEATNASNPPVSEFIIDDYNVFAVCFDDGSLQKKYIKNQETSLCNNPTQEKAHHLLPEIGPQQAIFIMYYPFDDEESTTLDMLIDDFSDTGDDNLLGALDVFDFMNGDDGDDDDEVFCKAIVSLTTES